MNTILMAVDDGLTNANYNWADVFFLVAAALALLAAVAAYGPPATPTADGPRFHGWHHWAPALLSLAVACTAFAFFLL